MKILFASLVLFTGFAAVGQITPTSPPDSKVPDQSGSNSSHRASNQLEVLSDTMGVDFGPYLSGVLPTIRKNWFNRIPVKELSPAKQKGKVTIEFGIQKSGELDSVAIDTASGDAELDRAALNGIMASGPFPALPSQFPGSLIKLRIYFYYNPNPDEKFPSTAPKANDAKGSGPPR